MLTFKEIRPNNKWQLQRQVTPRCIDAEKGFGLELKTELYTMTLERHIQPSEPSEQNLYKTQVYGYKKQGYSYKRKTYVYKKQTYVYKKQAYGYKKQAYFYRIWKKTNDVFEYHISRRDDSRASVACNLSLYIFVKTVKESRS